MAPTLTSNSFLLTTTPHSRLILKNPTFRVFAKRGGPLSSFQLGKPKGENSEENETGVSVNSSPFNFNFGKVPDVKSLIPVLSSPGSGLSFGNSRRKDPGTVFVAGATGLAGIRIAQTLLREGFSVRAGVPDLGAAQDLGSSCCKVQESKRLNAVESAFQDAESIAKAIGNASKVVVTIGPAENGATTEVSASDALQVIEAAQLAGVGHVAIIYDSSNRDINLQSEGSTAANDYKVAKAQIASVVANVFSNTAVTENKIHQPQARPVDELFSAIPKDGRRAAYAEALAKARAEEGGTSSCRESSLAEDAQEKAEAAGASVDSLFSKAKDIGSGFSWDKFSSQITTAVQKSSQIPQVQIATPKQEPKPQGKQTESKPEVRKVFGGLFKQETIYVDDD
ncbi:hypothetical protein Patl1_31280 [Pistacia atlantica]|uniref:Uncharacterized protein n=1 Tax=Pistacia atlantica TaxID=434234 RepID=A0ACC1AEF0_9ROSI|nr:hypothetical protein Patl1_31280 [Pistacia atlantica]